MKFILLTVMLGVAAAIEIHPEETHDHETLPADPGNVRMRLDCALDITPCDEVSTTYKEQFPRTLKTACAECKPEAKKLTYAFLNSMQKLYPEDYNAFVKKYDPEGKYMENLLSVVAVA